jgi:predicted Zn-dependent protease
LLRSVRHASEYGSFTDVSLQSGTASRGSFTAALQREIKSTVGTDYLGTAGSTGLSYATVTGSQRQNDMIYAAGLSDLSVTKQTDQNGAIVSSGVQSWTETFNLASLSGSDTATITYNLYFYYSTQYITAFGQTNIEASALMTSVVITVKV